MKRLYVWVAIATWMMCPQDAVPCTGIMLSTALRVRMSWADEHNARTRQIIETIILILTKIVYFKRIMAIFVLLFCE